MDLETHIQDILGVIEYEDLRDFILLGHSYGGMVVTGVADRVPQHVRHLVYLDAFVPADGQSLNDLTAREPHALEGWLIPPNPPAPDTAQADLAWNVPRGRHQPARCFSQKLRIANPNPSFPRSDIRVERLLTAAQPGPLWTQTCRDGQTNVPPRSFRHDDHRFTGPCV